MVRTVLCLLLLCGTGCALRAGPGTAPEIPDSVAAACAAFPEENIASSLTAVESDLDSGASRADSLAVFQSGCEVTSADAAALQNCLVCGEAIYNSVYGKE